MLFVCPGLNGSQKSLSLFFFYMLSQQKIKKHTKFQMFYFKNVYIFCFQTSKTRLSGDWKHSISSAENLLDISSTFIPVMNNLRDLEINLKRASPCAENS